MTINEKRREVAQKLRDVATECYSYGVLEGDVLSIIGAYATDSACLVSSDSVFDVADLIDRPTCHISETDHEFEDSIRCDRCRKTFARPWEPFNYCPNCGAEVVEDD